MAKTLTVGATVVTLHDDMFWSDEHSWSVVEQVQERTLTGALDIEPGGTVTGDVYVMALGSYSPLLLRKIGIDLPVYPVKGYSITVNMPDAASQATCPVACPAACPATGAPRPAPRRPRRQAAPTPGPAEPVPAEPKPASPPPGDGTPPETAIIPTQQ